MAVARAAPVEDASLRTAVGERLLEDALGLARGQGATRVETSLLRGDRSTVILERMTCAVYLP